MKNKRFLDKKKRIQFKKNELKQKVYKMLLLNLQMNKNLYFNKWDLFDSRIYYQFKYYLILKLQKIDNRSFKTKISNRCIWTGRSRSVYRKYKISRIMFKQFSSTGNLPGFAKYSW